MTQILRFSNYSTPSLHQVELRRPHNVIISFRFLCTNFTQVAEEQKVPSASTLIPLQPLQTCKKAVSIVSTLREVAFNLTVPPDKLDDARKHIQVGQLMCVMEATESTQQPSTQWKQMRVSIKATSIPSAAMAIARARYEQKPAQINLKHGLIQEMPAQTTQLSWASGHHHSQRNWGSLCWQCS